MAICSKQSIYVMHISLPSFLRVHLNKMLITLLLLPWTYSFAEEPATDSRPLSQTLHLPFSVLVRETIVEINGKRFRKVEYKNETFYLQLLENEASHGDLALICHQKGSQAFNLESVPQVMISAKMTKRSELYIQGLRTACADVAGGKKVFISPAIEIGFVLGNENSKDLLKKKRLFVTPLTPGLGFGADW